MAQTEIIVSAEHGDRPTVDGRVGRIAVVEGRRSPQSVLLTERSEVIIHPTHGGYACIAHPPRGLRSVARETLLGLMAIALAGACRSPRESEVHSRPVDVPHGSVPQPPARPTPTTAPEERTSRWARAWSNDPLDAETLRTLLAEATQADGYSASLALGRRAPLAELGAIAGTLSPQQLDPFFRGLSGRTLGPTALPNGWRLAWQRDPPSVALATIIGKNNITLDPAEAPRSESLMLDGDLTHQFAGARSIQNASVPIPSLAALGALHPVAFPLAMRALATRGGVPTSLWLNLIALVGARVHPNPRSWSGAWLSLMDAVPSTDPSIRAALLAIEPLVTQVDLQPVGAFAAYRCAVALRLDRVDQGHRTEVCAT